MDSNSFFNQLEIQYAKKLPLVVYSRPINSIIKCWLQKDDALYTTENFSESGFVFAPFDLNNDTILLPQEKCEHHTLEVSNLKTENKNQAVQTSNGKKSEHIHLVSKGIDIIESGNLDKVVLSRFETKDLENANPVKLFKRLFNTYKNAMVYCWYHPKVGLWIGATPELLFKVEGKRLTTISLAGTKPFIENKAPNWASKETVEQQIVTDYITKQIEPYTHSVSISELETVRAGNLIHLKTRVISTIKDDTDLKSIIDVLHPTPAVCGFPKEKAKQFIIENENYDRNYYTGFLGELNLKESKSRNTNRRNVENNAYSSVKIQSNFYVNLRCAEIKDNKAFIYVGGGITKDSNPENEWEETVNKTKTILKVLY
ncbi:chorismate-binding protein [Winogradskyella ursingii]|uniref:chorismate-binding protein n=1 Tax=Winogradskyella ursingii TaxID=2686079 RepID=UPI0015C88E22|nr:chorismate-binding protein [Winogradskyella ursingii]